MFHKALILTFCILVTAPLGSAQTADSRSYDFGKIGIADPMEHTFQFQNDGSEILEIKNVQMNPPLIVTKMTSRIEPGGMGSVTVRLDQPRVKGEFRGAVVVNFKNQGIQPLTFTAKGELVPPIEFKPMGAFFVTMQRGEEQTASIEITNHETDPFEILSVQQSSGRFTTEVKTLEEGRRFELSLTMKGDGPAGRQTDVITLVTSSRDHPFLKVQANTNLNERVYTFPPVIEFSGISVMGLKARPKSVESLSFELTVYQKGGKDFQVHSAQSNVPFLRLTPFQAHLKDRYGVRVEIIPEKLRNGPVNGSVVIATNDPEFPTISVPVMGVVEGSW